MDSPLLDQTPEDDLWEDYSVFKRNKITGELILKPLEGAAPGVNPNSDFSLDYSSPISTPQITRTDKTGFWNFAKSEIADKLHTLKSPMVQGESWLVDAGLASIRSYNRLIGDDKEARLYEDAQEEYDKVVASYNWGENQTGGRATQEFFSDGSAFLTSLKDRGVGGADYGRAWETIQDAALVASSQVIDIALTRGLGKVMAAPVKGGTLLTKAATAISQMPYIKPVVEAVSKTPLIAKMSPAFADMAAETSIGFGAREFISQEDKYTKAGLSQFVALPSALGAAATQMYLEYLGSSFMGRIMNPEASRALFKEVKPSIWRDMLSESTTEFTQSIATGAFEDTPLVLTDWDHQDFHIKNWITDGAQSALIAPITVLGFEGAGHLKTKVSNMASDAISKSMMSSPTFKPPTTSLGELKTEKPGEYKNAMDGLYSLYSILTGTMDPNKGPVDFHLKVANAWAKKFSYISEVQDIYKRISDRYKEYNGKPRDSEIDANAIAEGGTNQEQPIFRSENLEEILSDRVLRTMQAFVADDRNPSTVPKNANDILGIMGKMIDLNGAATPNGVEAVVSAAHTLYSDIAYHQMTRAQRESFARKSWDIINNSLVPQEVKDEAKKNIENLYLNAEASAQAKFAIPENLDKIKESWNTLVKSVQDNYAEKDATVSYANMERAANEHISALNAVGVGRVTIDHTQKWIKEKLAILQEELSTKAASAQGMQKEDLWKIKLYSHLASFLGENDARVPSLPENVIDRTHTEQYVNNIAESSQAARKEFDSNLQMAHDLDSLSGSILGDQDVTSFSSLSDTIKNNALGILGAQDARKKVTDFLSTVMTPEKVAGYNLRIDSALSALQGMPVVLPSLKGPFEEISNIFAQYGIDKQGAYDFLVGKDSLPGILERYNPGADLMSLSDAVATIQGLSDIKMPMRIRVDEAAMAREAQRVEDNSIATAVRQTNMAMLANGQAPLPSRYEATSQQSVNPKAVPNETAMAHAQFWAQVLVKDERVPKYPGKQMYAIAHSMLKSLFKASSTLAIETARALQEERGGRRLSGKEVADLGLEVRDIGSALFAVINKRIAEEMSGPNPSLDNIIHNVKMDMIKSGGVSRRYMNGKDKSIDPYTESSILFTKFAEELPDEIRPYLDAAFKNITAENDTGTGINKDNISFVLDSFSAFLDKLKPEEKFLGSDDIDEVGDFFQGEESSKLSQQFTGTELQTMTGRGPSSIIKNLYLGAYKKAITKKNIARKAKSKSRTNLLSRQEILAAAGPMAAEFIKNKEIAKGNDTIAPPQAVLSLLENGYAGYLHGSTDLVPTAGPRAVSEADNQKITTKALNELESYIESKYKDDPNSEEAQAEYNAGQDRIIEEHNARSLESKLTSDKNGNSLPPVDPILLQKAKELYERATNMYHSQRTRIGDSISPNMTHKFSSNGDNIHDRMWDQDILALMAGVLENVALPPEVKAGMLSTPVKSKNSKAKVTTFGDSLIGYFFNGKATDTAKYQMASSVGYFAMQHLQDTPYRTEAPIGDNAGVDELIDIRSRVFVQRLINHSVKSGSDLPKQLLVRLTFPGQYKQWASGNAKKEFSSWVSLNEGEVRGGYTGDQETTNFFNKLLKDIKFSANPANVGTLSSTSTKLQELFTIAGKWNAAMLDEVAMASLYHNATKAAGVQRWEKINGRDIGTLLESAMQKDTFDNLTIEEQKAFYYVRKFVNATQNALFEGNTPGALIAQMTAHKIPVELQVMELGMLDAFISRYAATNKDSAYDMLNKAMGRVSFTDLNPGTMGLHWMNGINNYKFPSIDIAKDLGVFPKSGGILLHEFLHGIISNGTFARFIGPQSTAAIEKFLGTTLNKANQEKIQSLVTSVLIGNTIPGLSEHTNKVIQDMRSRLLSGISMYYHGNSQSGYPVLGQDVEINSNLSQIIVGALSLKPSDSQKLFELGGDGRITLSTLALQGHAIHLANVNLVPLFHSSSNLLERIINNKAAAKAFALSDAVLKAGVGNKVKKEGIEGIKTDQDLKDFFSNVVGIKIDPSDYSFESIGILKEWARTIPELHDGKLRVENSIRESDQRILDNSQKKPGQQAAIDDAHVNIANSVLSTVGIPGASSDVLDMIQGILGANAELPLATDHKEYPTKMKAIIASFRKMSLVDKYLRVIEPTTHHAENLLKKLGLSREFLLTHTINGINEFAKKVVFDKVRAFRGSKWAGNLVEINEGLADILDDIDKTGMSQDVWAWLGAHRQLEIERGSKLGVLLGKDEMVRAIDPTSSAAARLVVTDLKMRHGMDGGEVAEYAKRLVRWQNATVLEPQLRLGMVSQREYDAAVRSSDWYIPTRKIEELYRTNPFVEKSVEDGTNTAMRSIKIKYDPLVGASSKDAINPEFRSLRHDTTGAEHPLQEMVSRAINVQMMSTVQEIRQNLISAIIKTSGGPDEAKKHGVELLVATDDTYADKEEITDPAEIRSVLEEEKKTGTPPKWISIVRKPGGGVQVLRSLIGKPISRDLINRWLSDHAKDLGINEKNGKNRNVHTVWENGNPTYYLMHDGEILDALDGIHPTHLTGPVNNIVYKLFSGAARMASSLIVRNPVFFGMMPLKDLPTSFSRSQFGVRPGDVLSSAFESVASVFPSLAKEFPNSFKDFTASKEGVAPQDSIYGSLLASRSDESIQGRDAENLAKNIAHHKYRPLGGVKVAPRIAHAIATDVKAWRNRYIANKAAATENYNSILKKIVMGYAHTAGTTAHIVSSILGGGTGAADSTPRLAERKAAERLRDSGVPIQDLFIDYVDRNLTLDFARKSPALAFINGVYAFAAPGFQDFGQFLKNIKDPRTAGIYALRSIVAFSIPALVNYAVWHDDPEWQEEDYWEKYNFLYFKHRTGPNGEKQGFYRAPWGLGWPAFFFKDPIIAALQYGSGRDPDAFKDLLQNGWQQSPMSMARLPGGDVTPAQSLMSAALPTALDPLYNVSINRDAPFTQNPIDASIDAKGLGSPNRRDLKKAGVLDVAAANTPPFSSMDWTPRQSSFFITRTFPGIGATAYTFGNKLFTKLYRDYDKQTDIGETYREPLRLQPWAVSSAYGEKSQSVQRFYQASTELGKRLKDYADYSKVDGDSAFNVLRKHPELSKDVPTLFKDTSNYIREMRSKKESWIESQIKLGYDSDEVYAAAVQKFDIPVTIRAAAAMDYYYQVKGQKK